LVSNHGLKEYGLKEYARMEYAAESEHMAFLFETSAPPTASIIRMRERSALLSSQCKAHRYYASACMSVFAVFGCAVFLLQFAILFT